MKFSLAAVLVSVASAVYAQTTAVANAGVAVNLPSYGQVIDAGKTFTITWTVEAGSTSNTINTIALMKGGSANLESYIPNILSAAIPVTPSTYDWNIPATVETGPSYVLALTGSNGATTYSTYFTIIGAAPGVSNTTAPSAAASSVAPAASSGASAAPAASSGAPAASSGASGSAAAPSATTSNTSAASGLKAGLAGVAGVAVGAAALLL